MERFVKVAGGSKGVWDVHTGERYRVVVRVSGKPPFTFAHVGASGGECHLGGNKRGLGHAPWPYYIASAISDRNAR